MKNLKKQSLMMEIHPPSIKKWFEEKWKSPCMIVFTIVLSYLGYRSVIFLYKTIVKKNPERRIFSMPKGNENFGNTCFFNATVQTLFWTNHLQQELTIFKGMVKCSRLENLKLTMEFHDLITAHGMNNDHSKQLKAVLRTLRERNYVLKPGQQEDSMELLSTLLNGIEEEIQNFKELNNRSDINGCPVTDLFNGKFITVYVYGTCRHVEVKTEDFFTISVPIVAKEQANLMEMKPTEENCQSKDPVNAASSGTDQSHISDEVKPCEEHIPKCIDHVNVLAKTHENILMEMTTTEENCQSKDPVNTASSGTDQSILMEMTPTEENCQSKDPVNTASSGTDQSSLMEMTPTEENCQSIDPVNTASSGTDQSVHRALDLLSSKIPKTDLENGLYELTKIKTQSNFTCSTCSTESEDNKCIGNNFTRYMILHPPPILVLQINRITLDGRQVQKDNSHVTFPRILDVSSYSSVAYQLFNDGGFKLNYALYAVIVHTGVMKSGHYYAYVNTAHFKEKQQGMLHHSVTADNNIIQNQKIEAFLADVDRKIKETINICEPSIKDDWYYVSDRDVRKVSTEEALFDPNAYMLFYERSYEM